MALSLVIGLPSSYATDRYYDDIEVRSGNGTYLAKAVSPDNRDRPVPIPFADHFVYSLEHVATGKTLWKWGSDQTPRPDRMFVHDSGIVVLNHSGESFTVVGLDGSPQDVFNLHEVLPQVEKDQWMHWTTGGYLWSGNSLWYFCEVQNRLHFVVRTWWDRRFVIDLQDAKLLTLSEPFETQIEAHEREYVLSLLAEGAKKNFRDVPKGSISDQFQTAAFVAGKLKLKEAIPYLEQLDAQSTESTESTSVLFSGKDSLPIYSNRPRQIAQLSLRRLGVMPRGYPVICFEEQNNGENWKHCWKGYPEAVRTGVDRLVIGATITETLETLGSPDLASADWVDEGETEIQYWQYDLQGDKPKTVHLTFRNHKLHSIEKKAPKWLIKGWRDEDFSNY